MERQGNCTDKSRVLEINKLRFMLSKSFEGTLSEALREVADYLEKPTRPLNTENKEKTEKSEWNDFMDTVERGGQLSCVGIDCHRFNVAENKWDKLPRGIVWI